MCIIPGRPGQGAVATTRAGAGRMWGRSWPVRRDPGRRGPGLPVDPSRHNAHHLVWTRGVPDRDHGAPGHPRPLPLARLGGYGPIAEPADVVIVSHENDRYHSHLGQVVPPFEVVRALEIPP